jgi:hypothetical protein
MPSGTSILCNRRPSWIASERANHHDALDAQLDVVKALSRIAPIHREVLVLLLL